MSDRACRCWRCGAHLAPESELPPPTITVESLRAACLAAGEFVVIGDRVREDTAAKLLDRSPGTLRNWRGTTRPIKFCSVNGRAVYELADIAAFLQNEPRD